MVKILIVVTIIALAIILVAFIPEQGPGRVEPTPMPKVLHTDPYPAPATMAAYPPPVQVKQKPTIDPNEGWVGPTPTSPVVVE